jgi:hypothetical protein
MSRWVNGSLEDALMVSISPRAKSSPFVTCVLRAEEGLPPWDLDVDEPGDEPPATRRSDGTGDARRDPAAFLEELAADGLDLGLRLLVVDSIAAMLVTRGEDGETMTFFTQAAAASALRESLDLVCARGADPRARRVMASEAPLGAYVKGLYLRAGAAVRALELLGFQSLDGEGDLAAFGRALDAAAGYHFVDLRDAIRRDLATLRIDLGHTPLVKSLRDAVEHLFVTTARLGGVRAA